MNNISVKEVQAMMIRAKKLVLETMNSNGDKYIFVDIKGFKYLISWQGFIDDEEYKRYYVVELIRYKPGKGRVNFTKTQGDYITLKGWRRTAGEQAQFRFENPDEINI